MDTGWKTGKPCPRIILDPQITPAPGPWETAEESCLSIPGQPIAVSRPQAISLAHFDLTGRWQVLSLSGIDARVAQHEADHLDGCLIIDHGASAIMRANS